jgi:DNA-binding transcriptional regulator YhcF (GntR family)
MTGLDALGDLDPDDPTQVSQQIADRLRAAILTSRYEPGQRLPSQPELAQRFGVARETVKRALDVLRQERLIVTRQGSGAFVREQKRRPGELRGYIESAFESSRVSIDFAGFSGETLYDALRQVSEKIRAGSIAPESLNVRVLVCDTSAPMALPIAVASDDAALIQARADEISRRSAEGVLSQVQELAATGLVPGATAEVRMHNATPLFKLCVINNQEAFFGFYNAVKREIDLDGRGVEFYDLLGKDVPLFHYVADDESSDGALFIDSARKWLDSLWNTVAREYQRD